MPLRLTLCVIARSAWPSHQTCWLLGTRGSRRLSSVIEGAKRLGGYGGCCVGADSSRVLNDHITGLVAPRAKTPRCNPTPACDGTTHLTTSPQAPQSRACHAGKDTR